MNSHERVCIVLMKLICVKILALFYLFFFKPDVMLVCAFNCLSWVLVGLDFRFYSLRF